MSGARLRDCTLEQPLGLGGAHQHADAHATGRLAEDRDIVGVAAELADVIADPLQRRDLVAHAVVAALRIVAVGQGLVVEIAECSETVVDRDHHNVASSGQVLSVVDRRRAGAAGEAAAVDPEHDRTVAVVEAGRPDIEGQAIFVNRHLPCAEQLKPLDEGLH